MARQADLVVWQSAAQQNAAKLKVAIAEAQQLLSYWDAPTVGLASGLGVDVQAVDPLTNVLITNHVALLRVVAAFGATKLPGGSKYGDVLERVASTPVI